MNNAAVLTLKIVAEISSKFDVRTDLELMVSAVRPGGTVVTAIFRKFNYCSERYKCAIRADFGANKVC
jgi:hypothetical protein